MAQNSVCGIGSRAGRVFSALPVPAYICTAAAAAGSFVCGVKNLSVWLILVFSSYTDIMTKEIYIFPIRTAIAVKMVRYVIMKGVSLDGYVELSLCIVLMMFLSRVFRAYAEGDLEIFIMLVLTAAVRGENITNYTLKLLWLSGVTFVSLLAAYIVLHNIQRMVVKKETKLIMSAPMAPSIAAAFLMCCIL